jgi:hypothetical protein
MPKPAGPEDNKGDASRTDTGRSYDRSVKIADPGGATVDNPHPASPFVDPNPMGQMLGPEWEKRSR